jgi:hypothetical protein
MGRQMGRVRLNLGSSVKTPTYHNINTIYLGTGSTPSSPQVNPHVLGSLPSTTQQVIVYMQLFAANAACSAIGLIRGIHAIYMHMVYYGNNARRREAQNRWQVIISALLHTVHTVSTY